MTTDGIPEWKRVTPERAKAAAEAIGFKIIKRSTWMPQWRECCPMAACAAVELPPEQRPSMLNKGSDEVAIGISDLLGVPTEYTSGFMSAFDGRPRYFDADNLAYNLGRQDGLACRVLLEPNP